MWTAGQPLADRLTWELDYAGRHYRRIWKAETPGWLGGTGPGVFALRGHAIHKTMGGTPSLSGAPSVGEFDSMLADLHTQATTGVPSEVEAALTVLAELAGVFSVAADLDELLAAA